MARYDRCTEIRAHHELQFGNARSLWRRDVNNDNRLNRSQNVLPRSEAGRTWRAAGGVIVSVMTRDAAGVECAEPWIASCDTHGNMIGCPTKRSAESAARNRDWCGKCSGDVTT